MLSPYRGVMHSVVTQWADAVTIDGRNWTLYVRGECLYDDLDQVDNPGITVPDVKYGTWSEDTGFRRAPIRMPTFDARVRVEGEQLLAAVIKHAGKLPFALADNVELWLLHGGSGMPLALIASACSDRASDEPPAARWTPGQACMAESNAARKLFDEIATLAGSAPRARWYQRHDDAGGTPLDQQENGQYLAADHFPHLFLDRRVLDAQQRILLDALLHWQSPSLLQLPTLSTNERRRFEAAACLYAQRLAEQLPLYPCVLDRTAVTAALVEARLRNSHASGACGPSESNALSPDYVEMPD